MDDKKKRFLIIIAGVLVLLFFVTGILLLANRNKTDDGGTGTTSGNIELTYWGLWEPTSVMQPIIDEFETLYPNIKILYSQQTFTSYGSRLYTRLQQSSSSQEPAPDIFRIHNTWLPKYYTYLSPLPTSIMTRETYSQTFYPTALSDFTGKDGNIYAIPLEIDGLMVFYNKQLLAEQGADVPPEDWDTFFELAQKLTTKDSAGRITQSGLAMGTSKNIMHSAEILSFLLMQEGVEVIDSTRTSVSLDTPSSQRVFETYTNFALGEDAVWSPTLRTDLEMFFAGELAMMIAPSWRAFDIIESAPNIEFDTAPLPQLKANDEIVHYSTYWGDAVSKTAANTEAAWTFITFLAQKEQQMEMFSNSSKIRAFGEPYSLVELNSEMVGKTYVSAIAEMAPYMRSWQMGDEQTVNAAIDQAITDIVESGREISSSLKVAEETINATIVQTNK